MFLRMVDSELRASLQSVLARVAAAAGARTAELQKITPRVVAVSKTNPASLVEEAYKFGQRHFGENYVKELEEKATNPQILSECPDICWHYIGLLQRNKANKVASIPQLYMVETVDSAKVADALDSAWDRQKKPQPLKIMVQVNTSGEKQKNGCDPSTVVEVISHILNKCSHLQFVGLMTIGALDHDLKDGPNPDFQRLIECRKVICTKLNVDLDSVELSMGMSNDFEHAISVGSTNVRVGSVIFGARAPKTTIDTSAPNDKVNSSVSV